MPKTHKFNEKDYKQVLEILPEVEGTKKYRQVQVLQLRMEGYKNEEIAKITKYSKSRVSALVCEYVKKGLEPFCQENRKGGNNRNLTNEEEIAILAEFEALSEAGHIITAWDIKAAFDKKLGRDTGRGYIYMLLARHNWRKVMPRPKHPKKASDEVIEASNLLNSL